MSKSNFTRRGVMKTTTERAPGPELDADDRAEITILLQALEADDVCSDYPFGPE